MSERSALSAPTFPADIPACQATQDVARIIVLSWHRSQVYEGASVWRGDDIGMPSCPTASRLAACSGAFESFFTDGLGYVALLRSLAGQYLTGDVSPWMNGR